MSSTPFLLRVSVRGRVFFMCLKDLRDELLYYVTVRHRDALQWDDSDGAGRHQTGLYSGQAMTQEIILLVLYIEHRICYNVLYDRQNEQWEKLLQTTICWRKLLQPWPNRTTISSWPTRKILTLRQTVLQSRSFLWLIFYWQREIPATTTVWTTWFMKQNPGGADHQHPGRS